MTVKFVYISVLIALILGQGTAAPSFLQFRPSARVLVEHDRFSHANHKMVLSKALANRGGADAEESSSSVVSDVLLSTFAVLTGLNGVGFAFIPKAISKSVYGVEIDSGSLDEYCCTAIGCHCLDIAITAYLAASGTTSVEQALGFGLLPDMYFIAKDILDGTFTKFHVKTFMTVGLFAVGAGAYSLITGKWNPLLFAKVLAILPLAKDLYVYIDPVRAGKKMMDEDLSESPKTKALYRRGGQWQLISSFLKGALAFGMKPIKAVGYTNLLAGLSVIDVAFVRKDHDDMGNSCANSIIYLALHAAMAVVFTRE